MCVCVFWRNEKGKVRLQILYVYKYIYIWISDIHIYTHGERYKESVRKQNSMRILLKSQLKVIGKNMK